MIKLIPKSRAGSERIIQNGDIGMILNVQDRVHFSFEDGPWLLVNAADPVSSWVHATRDPNFEVQELNT